MQLRTVEKYVGHDELVKWFSDYNLSDFLTSEEIKVINDRGTWNKTKLAEKIIRHFYLNEIGFETIGVFHLELKNFLEETMEEYLPLIYSASIKYDPLVNVDFTETYTSSSHSNGSTSEERENDANSSTDGLSIQSDTPQGEISKEKILDGSYASSTEGTEGTAKSHDEGKTNGTMTNDGTQDYERKTKGNSGVSATAQKMIEQYRDNIRAIDREIIEKARQLFMVVY